MPSITTEKKSLIPVLVMVIFTILLIGALLIKVYHADRDLGILRSEKYQARLASESGINYAVAKMRDAVRASDRPVDPEVLTSLFFEDRLPMDQWIQYGVKTKATFRITSVRKMNIEDDEKTTLINEGQQYQVIAEGRCGSHCYSTAAIIQLYDLAKLFGVFQSLDEYYYGNPLQPYVQACGSFNEFYKLNAEYFDSGKITHRGKIIEPGLLVKMFEPNGKSPFKTPNNIIENYSRFFVRNGNSPCKGPLYCGVPVVVDSHEFNAPAQSALYFYHRPGTTPVLKEENSVRKMYSSPRVQHTGGGVEQRNYTRFFVDRDAIRYSSFIPAWTPNLEHMRKMCKERGIYIDADGKGYLNGNAIDIDYHPGVSTLYSDSYLTPNSSKYEQDELKDEKFVVLSSDTKYQGFNNISASNLQGARMIFSERSVFIRGDIGSDLIITTPGHIFITGPTNIDSNLNLFLVAAEGTAISTVDLEEVIKKNNPESDFVEAAREWLIRAVIYKPGAGVYTAESKKQADAPISFRGVFSGKSLKLHIVGSCIGGNLQRWMNNTETDSLVVEHDASSMERMPISPVTVNLLRMRTRAESFQNRH